VKLFQTNPDTAFYNESIMQSCCPTSGDSINHQYKHQLKRRYWSNSKTTKSVGNKFTLWIICDTSGSMSEGGKNLLVRGMARVSEQYCRLGYGCANLKLVAWNKDALVVDWVPDEEYPQEMLLSEGPTSVDALVTLCQEQTDSKFLLITDGFLTLDDTRKFKRWRSDLPREALRVIKLGGDANPHLKGPDVFDAEEIFAALDGWLEGGVT
jgi:hypothetical protein